MNTTEPYDEAPVTVDRRAGALGEVVLRRRGGRFEIIANGCFLMDTSDGRSERLLVDAALGELAGGTAGGLSVLVGGLGVGFTLARAAGEPRWGRITVVEAERAVIDWHRDGPLARFSAGALADPRVTVVHGDLVGHLLRGAGPHDALCLDIDNGPDWTVAAANDGLYSPAGLAACRAALRPGGVLAVWSARPSRRFGERLRYAGFHRVRTVTVPVARGVPDVVHLAIRPPNPT